MKQTTTPSLAQLQHAASSALTDYLTKDDGRGTERLRAVAEAFVSAREHFFTQEGEPDWLGRTYAYRRWVREAMSLANVPQADLATVQGAVRYHSGSVLRAHLDPETLAALGLRVESPRERSVEKRERAAETLSLFGGGGQEITSDEDVAYVGQVISATLRRISPEVIAALPDDVRAALAEAVRPFCADEKPRRSPRK